MGGRGFSVEPSLRAGPRRAPQEGPRKRRTGAAAHGAWGSALAHNSQRGVRFRGYFLFVGKTGHEPAGIGHVRSFGRRVRRAGGPPPSTSRRSSTPRADKILRSREQSGLALGREIRRPPRFLKGLQSPTVRDPLPTAESQRGRGRSRALQTGESSRCAGQSPDPSPQSAGCATRC
jgi:hypothetical protein